MTACGIEARAVGTGFLVQIHATGVEVMVTEGNVAVATSSEDLMPEDAAPVRPPRALLKAGRRIVIEFERAPETLQALVQPASAAEMIEFSGTPLAEAITVFNRHTAIPLVLDPALGGLQMSGVLRADNIELFLRLLKNEFGIEAESRRREIHLYRP